MTHKLRKKEKIPNEALKEKEKRKRHYKDSGTK
jgi:hypothetical protein